MLRVIILSVVLAVVLGDDKTSDHQHERCHKLDCSSLRCCKMDGIQSSAANAMQLIKECFKLPDDSCEKAICMGTKIGYGTADGKVDKAKAKEVIERDFGGQKDMAAAVIDKCVNGDLSLYGEANECELVKYGHCAKINILGRCTNWDTEGQCEEVKKTATECFQDFA